MELNIYRLDQVIASNAIDDRTIYHHKLMGEHKIVADFIAIAPLPVQLGDYIIHRNEKYYINTPPQIEKINNFTYRYVIDFEGEIYKLYNKIFMDEGAADFSYHGTPEDFLLLLLLNMNSIDQGWAIEKVDNATAQTLSFNGVSCRVALTMISEAFALEYRLVQKNIYLERSVGAETILQFEYGRGKGLYSLQRNKIEDKNVVTRVYGFGARKNLSYDYRDGSSRLVFEERILEKNTELYGIKEEGTVIFEEIYPQRTGTVTDNSVDDRTVLFDTDLNFNITEYLLEGIVGKVVFKSGALSGYEFEILNYRHSDNRIKIIPFVEENGYTLPNDLNFPEPGDLYTLVDINMPQIYIDEAEAKLKQRTQHYLDENSVPRVIYNLEIDEKYIFERGIELKVADLVRVMDESLGINNRIRVAEVKYPLVNPNKISAVIADTIPYTMQERLIADNVDQNTEIVNVDRRRIELARRSALRFRELQNLIFDPDGYFDPQIKPGSIETLMLSVGAKSQNFGLIGVTIEANSAGPNTLKISGGQLVHYSIEIEGLGYIWEMDPNIFENLDPDKHYFVYARCSATSLTGEWAVSETPKLVDAEAGKFLFNLGILYKVVDGRRDFDFTNGMTYINGDTITTGKIKSLDGLNFFDLTQGKFKIGNEESSLDYNVTEEGRLTLKGVLVTSFLIAPGAVIENLMVRSLKTQDEGRRLEILRDTNNLVLYDDQNRPVVKIDGGLDGQTAEDAKPGIAAFDTEENTTSSLTVNGIYSNSSAVKIRPPGRNITGVWTSVAGWLSKLSGHTQAAISGVNPLNGDKAYGGYFYGGVLIEGGKGLHNYSAMHVNALSINSSVILNEHSYFISCYNTTVITIRLPANPRLGRVIIIKRVNSAPVKVFGNGTEIQKENAETFLYIGESKGDTGIFHFDGYRWIYNVWFR